MKRIALVVLVLALGVSSFAQAMPSPRRPVSTFSIVAYDPETKELGVAVQSHWFCVGCIVAWAEAGVGAVATQSFVDPSYGKLGLDLMRAGRSAPDSLKGLLAADANRDVRQVAFIDAQGNVATWTGARDIDSAGHVVGGRPSAATDRICPGEKGETGETGACGFYGTGKNFSVEANMMLNDKVWPAMAKAFETTRGDLAERMMAALEAAQAVGGDIRGRQSAALIVVSGKPTGKSWQDRVFDLRVDDNPEPLKELRRLLIINRAYNHMNAGDLAVEHKDNEGALREYSAASRLVENVEGVPASRKAEMMFWHAIALVTMNRVDEALPLFKKVYVIDENWRELARRLPKSGLLPDDAKLIERITAK